MLDSIIYTVGILLIFIGFFSIAIGIILYLLTSKNGEVKGGGAIIIGPIPIIFGTDKKSLRIILILSFALTLIFAIAMVVYYLLLN